METISLKSDHPFDLTSLEKTLARRWVTEKNPDGGLTLHGNNSRVYVYLNKAVAQRCELFVDYSDIELAKEVLVEIGDKPEILVDADFGVVLSGDKFAMAIKANKSWDWRRTPDAKRGTS